MDLDTHVCIIGAGMSGLCTAIQLIRQYNTRKFIIIEKSPELAGTWGVNTYPGCGCDVPSHFYSFSFALKPDWSRKYAMQPEILSYFRSVAAHYDLLKYIKFGIAVESSRWQDDAGIWITNLHDQANNTTFSLRSKFLVSAVGGLSIPRHCELPGASNFEGNMFHSAQWDHTFDWQDKRIVVIGNGCSATQFMPIISSDPEAAKEVTQFANQAHWLAERQNPRYSAVFKSIMRYIPLAMWSYRCWLYWNQERDFRAFGIESGARYRAVDQVAAEKYIRENGPAEYVDFLVPKIEIGCKRRVNDTNYLECLHRKNVHLIYNDPIQEIVPTGVLTKSGKVVIADAIVLATGFQPSTILGAVQIYGQNGMSINDHWQHVSDGAPSAYFGTCLTGFPNFFMMMGPNTLSGHLSVIYTTECQVNFMMRAIRPIMRTLASPNSEPSKSRMGSRVVHTFEVTAKAEARDLAETQAKARLLVWASGCSSWFLDPVTGRNTVMFPDWQFKFWLRSFWVPWSDFIYTTR